MFVHHVNAFLELHHLRHVPGRCASLEAVPVDLVHYCVVCASSVKPMAGGAVSMPWILVEEWHSYRSHLAIQRQLSFSQSRHVCCRKSQSSNKRSQVFWAGRFVLLLVQSQLSPCGHVHQLRRDHQSRCGGTVQLRSYALQDGKRTQVQRIQPTPTPVCWRECR